MQLLMLRDVLPKAPPFLFLFELLLAVFPISIYHSFRVAVGGYVRSLEVIGI